MPHSSRYSSKLGSTGESGDIKTSRELNSSSQLFSLAISETSETLSLTRKSEVGLQTTIRRQSLGISSVARFIIWTI